MTLMPLTALADAHTPTRLTQFLLSAHGGLIVACFVLAGVLFRSRKQAPPSLQSSFTLMAGAVLVLGVGEGFHLSHFWHVNTWLEGIWQWGTILFLGMTSRTLLKIEAETEESVSFDEMLHQDPLTGVANRQGFELAFSTLENAIESEDLQHSLILLDLDGFQHINQQYGEQTGDTILMMVAQVLCDRTRAMDTVARLEGDRFALLLTGCCLDDAVNVAESLQEKLAAIRLPGETDRTTPLITASIGLIDVAADMPVQRYFERATEALQQAKETGKARISLGSMVCPLMPLNA